MLLVLHGLLLVLHWGLLVLHGRLAGLVVVALIGARARAVVASSFILVRGRISLGIDVRRLMRTRLATEANGGTNYIWRLLGRATLVVLVGGHGVSGRVVLRCGGSKW